ncbi:MAG: hypothetical protein IPI67_03120 [Myxococcales bacterium]|nr:hypothetical protein [Myxococcales bacterium]
MPGPRFLTVARWIGLSASLWLATPAFAQSDAELIRARKLYAQGLTQEAAGDWAGALGTFEDVARIKATPQVRFHLARCKENLGRFNEALGGYRMAEYEAEQGGKKEQSLVDEVKKAREALEGKIPKVTITRGKGAEAIKIELDGVALGDTQIGQPITLDPGPHVVRGIVAQGKSFKRTLTLAEAEQVNVVLDVPDDLVAPATETPAAPSSEGTNEAAPVAARDDAVPPEAPRVEASGSSAPWIIGGLGVASLAASAVFYSLRAKAVDDLDKGCIGRTCPDTLESTQKRGQTYSTLTGVTLGLGVVGVGTGVVMLLGRGRAPTTSPPAAQAYVQRHGGGFSFGGRF